MLQKWHVLLLFQMPVRGRVLRQRVLHAGPVLPAGRGQQHGPLSARRRVRAALRRAHRLRVPLCGRLGRTQLLAAGTASFQLRVGNGREWQIVTGWKLPPVPSRQLIYILKYVLNTYIYRSPFLGSRGMNGRNGKCWLLSCWVSNDIL